MLFLWNGTNKFWGKREKMMLKYFEEAYEKSDGKILEYGGTHVWNRPEWLAGYISEKHKIVSIEINGFKGVWDTKKITPNLMEDRTFEIILTDLTDDFLIESKYLGDESTYWRTFFDELHPARR